MRELGTGYRAAGQEPVLVVPGPRYADIREEQGRVITLPGPRVPGAGGYRVLADRRRVERLRARYAPEPGTVLLVLCSRLHPEKRPGRALDALAVLRGRGVPARLVVAGDGPLLRGLRRRARAERLPATFLGQVSDASELARPQATADVVLAPGPAETFGLSALEALAAGTPVVVSARSALPALIGTAGAAAEDTGRSYADGVQRRLARPEGERRRAARLRAEGYTWSAATAAFLAAHDAPSPLRTGSPAPLAAGEGPAATAGGPLRHRDHVEVFMYY
ncbi:glycosyltransferase family 4 protein [Streptomyces sp. NBC_01808]|uniref:glycosyltransferase family 4 protein n=1 Tax=Streptomyces sp. NBC_01808 TaxID=2975947 RepID=UPI002DD931CF|nr:glycosyltransferase family 4 protein [Streptomyces sp. NBC_01808]WSA42711.1 glycosyltransferase family 4 protein [Streptomyces sp. NBC_01808]